MARGWRRWRACFCKENYALVELWRAWAGWRRSYLALLALDTTVEENGSRMGPAAVVTRMGTQMAATGGEGESVVARALVLAEESLQRAERAQALAMAEEPE